MRGVAHVNDTGPGVSGAVGVPSRRTRASRLTARRSPLAQIAQNVGDPLGYAYDFGN
jgi:hypothetical protein